MSNEVREAEKGVEATQTVSSLPSSLVPLLSSPSRFIGRWRYRLNLLFRVWPKYKETHEAIARMKEIEVNGIRINNEGKPEIWHMTAPAREEAPCRRAEPHCRPDNRPSPRTWRLQLSHCRR